MPYTYLNTNWIWLPRKSAGTSIARQYHGDDEYFIEQDLKSLLSDHIDNSHWQVYGTWCWVQIDTIRLVVLKRKRRQTIQSTLVLWDLSFPCSNMNPAPSFTFVLLYFHTSKRKGAFTPLNLIWNYFVKSNSPD